MSAAPAPKRKGPTIVRTEHGEPEPWTPTPRPEPKVVPLDPDPYKGRTNGNCMLRIRVHPSTLRRIAVVAEYERVRAREGGKGKFVSTLTLGWILDALDTAEDRMLRELEAVELAARAGFAGKEPGEV